jgi:hypothetical protein
MAPCGVQVSIAHPEQDQTRSWLQSNEGPDHQAIRSSRSSSGRDSAGIVGIGSEDIDSASGGWNDRMGQFRGGDAEQSEAGGAAFVDVSAADVDATDTAPYHEAQSASGKPPSSVAARAADAARAVTAAVGAVSDHASPAAAATAEGVRAPAAIAAATIEVAVSCCRHHGHARIPHHPLCSQPLLPPPFHAHRRLRAAIIRPHSSPA